MNARDDAPAKQVGNQFCSLLSVLYHDPDQFRDVTERVAERCEIYRLSVPSVSRCYDVYSFRGGGDVERLCDVRVVRAEELVGLGTVVRSSVWERMSWDWGRREGWRKGGRERGREEGKEGRRGREGRREGERRREVEREGGSEGGREGGKEREGRGGRGREK